jgi:DNA replication and repair protein RecF
VRRLAAALAADKDTASPFPWAGIALDGLLENAIGSSPASELEDRYRAALHAGRARDAAAGRTLEGPHLTDLLVTHGPKGIAAGEASTGEQKALLVGLVLAHAGLVAAMTGITPVLLLDEIAAHLDPARRNALYQRLAGLGAQVWMSGADPAVFDAVAPSAAWFEVTPGRAERRA